MERSKFFKATLKSADLLPLHYFQDNYRLFNSCIDCSLFAYFLFNEFEKILISFKTLHSATLIFQPKTSYGHYAQAGLPNVLNPLNF